MSALGAIDKEKGRITIRGGYYKVFSLFNRYFNFIIAFILILLSLPLFIIIAIVVKLQDRGPVIYAGTRLGFHKKSFTMYKFRTLVKDAQQKIGAELFTLKMTANRQLVSTTGNFLRETRLDELPQLFNVLKGDMDLVGPRPVRPEVYDKCCRHIRGYDKRFSVKPGVIGYSQLFTPHSSPKRIRNLIDNKFLEIKRRYTWEVIIILFAIITLMLKVIVKLLVNAWNYLVRKKILHTFDEKRSLDRRKVKGATVRLGRGESGQQGYDREGKLVNINEEAMCIYTNAEIMEIDFDLVMEIDLAKTRKKGVTKKKARCRGHLYNRYDLNQGEEYKYSYVIKYEPVSPLNYYLVHQYFMHGSVA